MDHSTAQNVRTIGQRIRLSLYHIERAETEIRRLSLETQASPIIADSDWADLQQLLDSARISLKSEPGRHSRAIAARDLGRAWQLAVDAVPSYRRGELQKNIWKSQLSLVA